MEHLKGASLWQAIALYARIRVGYYERFFITAVKKFNNTVPSNDLPNLEVFFSIKRASLLLRKCKLHNVKVLEHWAWVYSGRSGLRE